MLDAICSEIHNYFETQECCPLDKYHIDGGQISLPFGLLDGQYFRIQGSIFNDGVHLKGDTLKDETFTGTVSAMAVPPQVIELSERIKKFVEQSGDIPSMYASESFAGYSYTKATGDDGLPLTWQKAFANELNRWRKPR